MPQAWPRETHLKRRRLIRPLFDRKRADVRSVAKGSVRVLYRVVARPETGTNSPLQAGFAVTRPRSKVHRNQVRRILRETLRTSPVRPMLSAPSGQTLTLMVVCRDADRSTSVRADLDHALESLAQQLTA